MRRSGCFTSGGGVAGLIQQHHGCSITGKGGVLVLTSIGFADASIWVGSSGRFGFRLEPVGCIQACVNRL
jgi:hypothetical protein